MAKKSIVNLNGFEELISKIQKAGGTVDRASESCCKVAGQVIKKELKSQMQSSDVDDGLINRMPEPKVEKKGNTYSVKVGYKKGTYNPNNLSDGYKVVFLNYGTPKRKKHGQVKARGFITKAKKKAKPQIKKAQEQTLETILERVKK